MRFKKLITVFLLNLLLIPVSSFAFDLTDVIEILNKINDEKLKGLDDKSQETINQIKTLQDLMKGNKGLGTANYTDYHSWGVGSDQWKSALNLYDTGTGELGNVAKNINNDRDVGFPINPDLKTVSPKELQNRFDQLQAKTALASRAASQLAFDKIQNQIAYMKSLQAKIDQTQDLKSSVDLQNRLIFENNMIQLEMLRMAALTNQQQAIQAQSDVNQSVMNKAFNAY